MFEEDTVYLYLNNKLHVCGEISSILFISQYISQEEEKKEIAILVFSYHAALIWTTLGQILNFKPRVSYIDSIRPLLLWLSGSEEAPLLRPKC